MKIKNKITRYFKKKFIKKKTTINSLNNDCLVNIFKQIPLTEMPKIESSNYLNISMQING